MMIKRLMVIVAVMIVGGCTMIYSGPSPADNHLVCPQGILDEMKNDPDTSLGCNPKRLASNEKVIRFAQPTAEQMIAYYTPVIEAIKNIIRAENPAIIWEAYFPGIGEEKTYTQMHEPIRPIPRYGAIPYDEYPGYDNNDAVNIYMPDWQTPNDLTNEQFDDALRRINPLLAHYGLTALADPLEGYDNDQGKDGGSYLQYIYEYQFFSTSLTLVRSRVRAHNRGVIYIGAEISGYLPERFWTIPPPADPIPGHYPNGYVAYPNGTPTATAAPTSTPTATNHTASEHTPPPDDPPSEARLYF